MRRCPTSWPRTAPAFRTSHSPAPDHHPAQGTPGPALQGPEAPGRGVWAVPPSPAQAGVSGYPGHGHAARPAPGPVPAQSKPGHGGAGTGTASGRGTNVLLKPACRLQPAQPPFLPTCSPPPVSPPKKDWGPIPAAECNSLPMLPGRARLLRQGSGCARASPCQDLALVVGLVARVVLQASPLPVAEPVGKLNGMSEINLFPLPKQPGNASFHQRQPQKQHVVVQWDASSRGAFGWREGMGKRCKRRPAPTRGPRVGAEVCWPKSAWPMAGFDLAPGQGSTGQGSIPSAPGCSGMGRHGEAPHGAPRNPAPPGRWRLPRLQPPLHGRND